MERKGADKPEFKITDKGGLSVYLGTRYPVTIYVEQWEKLLEPENVEALRAFINANRSKLKKKPAKDD